MRSRARASPPTSPRPRRLGPERLPAGRALGRAGALLAKIQPEDPPVLSWCDIDRPAVIVGRSAEAPPISWSDCEGRGLSVHRRSSGGGVVLWDADLVALDIILPTGHPLLAHDVVQAYRWVGEAAVEALDAVGLDAKLIDVETARSSVPGPLAQSACFGSLSPWEATVSGRKILGLSQVRRREGGIIQVGVPLHADLDALASIIEGPDGELVDQLGAAMAGVRDFDPSIERGDLVSALQEHLEACLGGDAINDVLTPLEQTEETRLAQQKHAALTPSD